VYTGYWWGNLRGKNHVEDPGLGGRIILKLIFRKWDGGTWTGWIWLRLGTGGGLLFKRGNEHSDSIKCGEFNDYLLTG